MFDKFCGPFGSITTVLLYVKFPWLLCCG